MKKKKHVDFKYTTAAAAQQYHTGHRTKRIVIKMWSRLSIKKLKTQKKKKEKMRVKTKTL